jgi:hypothetical protein
VVHSDRSKNAFLEGADSFKSCEPISCSASSRECVREKVRERQREGGKEGGREGGHVCVCVCVFNNVMTLVATLCRYDRTEVTKRGLPIFRACCSSSWSSSNMCLASFCATEDVYRLANLSAFYNLSAFNKLTSHV